MPAAGGGRAAGERESHTHAEMARPLRIGAQGRLVLPAAMRRSLGIEPGDEPAARIDEQRIVLEPRGELLRRMQDELRSARGKRSLVDELIAERRQEGARPRALPTSKLGGGLQPWIDPASNASLIDAADDYGAAT